MIERHIPRGNRTRSPSTSAPASFKIESASGSSRNSMPISSSTVSALYSMSSRLSSLSISKYGIFRSMNAVVCTCACCRAARLASLPRDFLRPARSLIDSLPFRAPECPINYSCLRDIETNWIVAHSKLRHDNVYLRQAKNLRCSACSVSSLHDTLS